MNTSSTVGATRSVTEVADEIVARIVTHWQIAPIIKQIKDIDRQMGGVNLVRSTPQPEELTGLIRKLLDEVISKANIQLSEYGQRRDLVDQVETKLKTELLELCAFKNWSRVDEWMFKSELRSIGKVSAYEPPPQYSAPAPTRPQPIHVLGGERARSAVGHGRHSMRYEPDSYYGTFSNGTFSAWGHADTEAGRAAASRRYNGPTPPQATHPRHPNTPAGNIAQTLIGQRPDRTARGNGYRP